MTNTFAPTIATTQSKNIFLKQLEMQLEVQPAQGKPMIPQLLSNLNYLSIEYQH